MAGARCARLSLASDLALLSQAREFAEEVARAAELESERAFDIKVAISEASANAVEHSAAPGGHVELCAWLYPDRLTVEVASPGPFLMRSPVEAESREHRGMGLPLMVALADEVAIRRDPDRGILVALTVLRPARQGEAAWDATPSSSVEVARERERAETLAAEAYRRAHELDATFDALADAVMIFDERGEVLRANAAAVTQLRLDPIGLSRGEIYERLRFRTEAGRPLALEELPSARAAAGEPVRNLRLLLRISEGSDLLVETSASPLILGGEPLGSVVAWRDIGEREALATQGREAMRQAEALNLINSAILASALDPAEIMDQVVVAAGEAMEVETAAITMREGDVWVVRHVYGFDRSMVGQTITDEQAPHGVLAANTRTAVVVDDACNDPRVELRTIERLGIRSVLVVPLLVKSGVAGVMYFNYHSAPVPFTPAKVELAQRVAGSVSVALENARLYLTERRMARTLQTALLTVPERAAGICFGHMHSSATLHAEVGGDFYDIFTLPDGRFGVVIGDVSGKGVEAAATASLVKNLLKAYAYQGSSPDEVMARTNEVLLVNGPLGSFTTAFLGLLDPASGKLAYSNAGHPPPVVAHSSSEVEVLPTGSSALGALPEAGYGQGKLFLGRSDLLLLYTDGATEARRTNSDGQLELYGERRLEEFVKLLRAQGRSARQVPELLYSEILSFSRGELSDDLAILCLTIDD